MKAVFLDRDGVINRDNGYVSSPDAFEFLHGAIDGMRLFVDAGYALIVVTNQSGIARGYYDEATFLTLTSWMCETLADQGVPILDVYHCPHHPKGTVPEYTKVCECRKPAPGMLLSAKATYGIDMSASLLIGDKRSDIQAGQRAGVGSTILLCEDEKSIEKNPTPTVVSLNLPACFKWLAGFKGRN